MAALKYMVEWKTRPGWEKRAFRFIPIGVWVVGERDGLDLTLRFLPGNREAKERAEAVLERLRFYGMRALPDDFLEFHQQNISGYAGMRGPIIETGRFRSAAACARWVLNEIRAGRIA